MHGKIRRLLAQNCQKSLHTKGRQELKQVQSFCCPVFRQTRLLDNKIYYYEHMFDFFFPIHSLFWRPTCSQKYVCISLNFLLDHRSLVGLNLGSLFI